MEGNSAPSPNSPIIIRSINKSVVHRICAGQVILGLPSAVKELVENSLDAGATSIEISLKDYGQESFQVIDNGCGISPNNFKVLALKHHTSKLTDFHDLQSLTTFGFRGEALSSLCALGDLTIETRTKNETVATHLTYDHSGLLTAERKTARQIGTTVTVNKLFSSLPVRSKELHRNIRKDYGKLITLLNAYALIAKGVRLVCTNTTGRSMKSVVLKTQGSGSLKDNIITVFGMSTFNCLEPLDICISETCKVNGFLSKPGYGSGRHLGDRQFFFVNDRPVDMPKVSKLVNESYKGANSRQYPVAIMSFSLPTTLCDVNVTPDKRKIFFSDEGSILQSLREALEKNYSPSHASYSVNRFVELNKEVMPKLCSGNERSELLKHLSPDGSDPRKELHDKEHADVLPAAVNESIEGSSTIQLINGENGFQKKQNAILKLQDTKKVNILSGSHSKQIKNHLSSAATDEQSLVPPGAVSHSSIVQSSLATFVTVTKRKHEDISTTLSEVPLLRNGPVQCHSKKTNTEMHSASSRSPINCPVVEDSDTTNNGEPQLSYCFRTEEVLDVSEIPFTSEGNKNDQESGKVEQCHAEKLKIQESKMSIESDLAALSCKNLENVSKDTTVAAPQLSDIPSDMSMLSPGLKIGFTLQFSLKDLKTRKQQRLSRFPSCRHAQGRMNIKGFGCYAAATLDLSQPENEEGKARALVAATRELERLFKKQDFRRMKVIGQFNLGFIVGKIDQDLFIVDQHAADEKYNFERLSQSTILNQQPLLRPLMMELSPEEEIVVSMHMGIFRRNGFSLEEDVLAPHGQRFRLKAVPFSKNITFGVADVKELISILADSQGECSMICSYKMDSSDSVCPPRVRAMLASRACRSSVMIGDPLGRNEMQKILERLADLRSPWNCPHGRPTMRHLVDLGTLRRRLEEDDTGL